MEAEKMYVVVFEYTEKAGCYEGVRTRTTFKDKEEFDNWYSPEIAKYNKIVAGGVSDEEARGLIEQTPKSLALSACLGAAKVNGKVDENILELLVRGTSMLYSRDKGNIVMDLDNV